MAFLLCIIGHANWSRSPNDAITWRSMSFKTATRSTRPYLDFYFEQLQQPSIQPDTPTYAPFGAQQWVLPQDVPWKTRLGNEFCIIDLDDRPFNASGQIFGPRTMTWQQSHEVHGLSLGILNHWLYSKIHGYKYYYVAVDTPHDRRTSWKKPAIMSKILQRHRACIYIDSDALFQHLDLPFEWLMNYWGLDQATTSLALALDPEHAGNQDEFGKEYLNTGFIVAENHPKTFEMLDAWNECPDDGGRYPECVKFRTNDPGRPTDQGGFGTYVRYDYAESIRELSCNEANGFPEARADCDGVFVRHVWTGKEDYLKGFGGEQMPGPYLEWFHEEFLATRGEFFVTEEEVMRL